MLNLTSNVNAELLGASDAAIIDVSSTSTGAIGYNPPEIINPLIINSSSSLIQETTNENTPGNNNTTTEIEVEDLPSPPIPMRKMISDPITQIEKAQAWATVLSDNDDVNNEDVPDTGAAIAPNRGGLHATDALVAIPGGGGKLIRSNSDEAAKISSGRPKSFTESPNSRHRLHHGQWHPLHSPHRGGNGRPISHTSQGSSTKQELGGMLQWLGFKPTGSESGSGSASERDIESGQSVMESLLLQREVIETFFCNICMENCAKTDGFSASACSFQHLYCIPCLASYMSIQVTDGVVDHYCPGIGECKAAFTTDELRSVMYPEDFARFERMTQVKKNPLYRECPRCQTGCSAVSKTNAAGEVVPVADIACLQCKHVYCFFHDNSHPGITCKAYARQQSRRARREMQASEALVGTLTKPCPNCHAATEKNGGCNHMTCQQCRSNWCWLCSSVLTDVTEHYKPGNFFGCPGAQFIEAPLRIDPFSGCCRLLTCCCRWSCWNSRCCISLNNSYVWIVSWIKRICRLLILAIAVPPAMAMAVGCLCGCWPLIACGNTVLHGTRWRGWHALKQEYSIPGVLGGVLILGLLDLVYLPLPILWFVFSYCVMRLRFDAETVALVYANEWGEPQSFLKSLGNFIKINSLSVWILQTLDF